MPKIKLVEQKHKHACSIACASMVTGKDYDAIIKEFGNNFHKYGIDDNVFLRYIGFCGFSTLEKEVTRLSIKDVFREELLRPFAALHLVKIKLNADLSANHWVVMKKNGKFLCPMKWSDKTIRNSYQILKVVGLYDESMGSMPI